VVESLAYICKLVEFRSDFTRDLYLPLDAVGEVSDRHEVAHIGVVHSRPGVEFGTRLLERCLGVRRLEFGRRSDNLVEVPRESLGLWRGVARPRDGDFLEYNVDLLEHVLDGVVHGGAHLVSELEVAGLGRRRDERLVGLTKLNARLDRCENTVTIVAILRGRVDRQRDVRGHIDAGTLRIDGQMHRRVRERAIFTAVEVVNEAGHVVELGRGGVPTNDLVFRVSALEEVKHLRVVVNMDRDFTIVLRERDDVGCLHIDLLAVLAAETKQSADDAAVVVLGAHGVLEHLEQRLRAHIDFLGVLYAGPRRARREKRVLDVQNLRCHGGLMQW